MNDLTANFTSENLKKDVIKAVKEDNIAFIKAYIKEKGSVSFKIQDDIEHPTLLFFAKSAEMVNLLIRHGVKKSVKNSFICHSNTALHHAIATKAPVSAVAAMARAGVGIEWRNGEKIDVRNGQKATPLLLALEKQNLSAVNALLQFEPDLYVKDANGNTPYHHVCAWERKLTTAYKRADGVTVSVVPTGVHNIRRKLEMMGADTSLFNNYGQTPSEYATCMEGPLKSRNSIVKSKSPINILLGESKQNQ